MKNQIQLAFKARHPDAKDYQIAKAVDKYIEVMLRAIKTSIASHGISNGEMSFSILSVRDEISKIRISGKQHWVINLMLANAKTALVIINFKGNKGKNSRVSLNPIYEKQIMEELINLNHELSTSRIKELESKANIWITANPDCIEDYIAKTLDTYVEYEHDPTREVYRQTLARNMLIASQIKSQIVLKDGESVLPEYWQETDSGRMYGHGLSLQRVPAKVRHAALGLCHQYDFKASSFGLMTGLATQIDPALQVADLSDYIKNRSAIRKKIAKEIGVTENKMKDVFTSLGFGANTVNNLYSSIRGSMNAFQYQALMANAQFRHIKEAMDRVRNTVANYYGDEFTLLGRTYSYVDPNSDPVNPKKRTKNQKLAWIYQVMEADAITTFGHLAEERGYDALLFAHDCVYFRNPLPGDLLNSIMYTLNKRFPMLRVEHTNITPIYKTGVAFKDYFEYKELSEAHKALVDAEELEAGTDLADPLDPIDGEFGWAIRALNGIGGGTSFDLNERLAARD